MRPPSTAPHFSFINRNADAFRTAVGTLDTMVARYGASSAQVKAWAQAQDIVFGNCSQGSIDFSANSDVSSQMLDEWNQCEQRWRMCPSRLRNPRHHAPASGSNPLPKS
jgi:hypothetical protein